MEESFTLKGEDANYLKVKLSKVYDFPEKICRWGGYDSLAELTVKCGGYMVQSTFQTSTGDIFSFYEQLRECNAKLKGTPNFNSYESNLTFSLTYDDLGHVQISGEFSEDLAADNRLQFSFLSDQSFMRYTLDELERIICKFGDLKGFSK